MDRRDLLKSSPLALALAAGHIPIMEEQNRPLDRPQIFYDAHQFGATGDGKTLDSPSINRAIEAIAAAGGGTLVFPAGTYLCFTIRLKSFVELSLSLVVAPSWPQTHPSMEK